nr:hypothetical protein [Oscillospiraceae bacterium]
MSAENIVTLCCSILVLAGVCVTAWSNLRIKSMDLGGKLDKLQRQVEKNREHDNEQYMAILRLTVMSEEMPLPERISAGKRYIDLGGNGEVKAFYYEHLLPEHTK